MNCDPGKIRMFFGGAELNDNNLIYQHDLKDGFSITVMKRQ